MLQFHLQAVVFCFPHGVVRLSEQENENTNEHLTVLGVTWHGMALADGACGTKQAKPTVLSKREWTSQPSSNHLVNNLAKSSHCESLFLDQLMLWILVGHFTIWSRCCSTLVVGPGIAINEAATLHPA